MRARPVIAGVAAGLLAGAAAQTPFDHYFSVEGDGVGLQTLPFLRLPPGARALSLGGGGWTTDDEAVSLAAEPASLAGIQDRRVSLSHSDILGEFRLEDLSLAQKAGPYGTLGLSMSALLSGTLSDARTVEEEPDAPTAHDWRLSAAYGQTLGRPLFGDAFSAGVRLDLLRSAVGPAVAWGYGLSTGALWRIGYAYRLGLSVANLSHGIRYSDEGSPLEALPLETTAEFGKAFMHHRTAWHLSLTQGNDGVTRGSAGGEWRLFPFFTLRAGYAATSLAAEKPAWAGLSGGFSVAWDMLTVDYGYRPMPPLGAQHAISLHVSRKPPFLGADKELLARGKRKFAEGEYAASLRFAREALGVNPHNFEAQALAAQAERELARRDERSVSLVFTANTRGILGAEWVDGKLMGGLPRRLSKMRELKGASPHSAFLDAGGLLRPGLSPAQVEYLAAAYPRLPYDAVLQGTSAAADTAFLARADLPWLKPLAGEDAEKRKVLEVGGGFRVLVLAAAEREGEAAVLARLERELAEAPPGISLRVLLYEGRLASAHGLARRLPSLDAVALSGETSQLRAPVASGATRIVCPGQSGTHLSQLTFTFDKTGVRIADAHRLIPLDHTLPEDEAMRALLAPVLLDLNSLLGAEGDAYGSQVIAYLREPESGRGGSLQLLDLATGRSYPVPHPGAMASQPVIGYGKNKVAFVGHLESGAREILIAQPGETRVDTLTRDGGEAAEPRFIYKGNALLYLYRGGDGKRRLMRGDPWSRETRPLAPDSLGEVMGFDVDPQEKKLAFTAARGDSARLYLADMDAGTPVVVHAARGFIGAPAFGPDGNALAFLVDDGFGDGQGKVQWVDLRHEGLRAPKTPLRAAELAWSRDGQSLWLSQGAVLRDLNRYDLPSARLERATTSGAVRSEIHSRPKLWGKRPGLLLETVDEQGKTRAVFLDRETREEIPLAGEMPSALR